MVALLRHFAEVFGAGEVFREARAIYLETPEGEREIQEEYARVRAEDPSASEDRMVAPRTARRTAGGESALEKARRLLGG